jgi:predicted acetyltransferase
MEVEIRTIGRGEEAAFVEATSAAFGERPSSAELAESAAGLAEETGWMASDAGRPVGAASLIELRLTVPGCVRVPLAGVSRVGVLPSHRRRGILRRLMALALDEARARCSPVAGLVPSEAPIYGRYGFGAAARVAAIEIETARARFPEPPADGGTLELVDAEHALAELPGLHDAVCSSRSGMVSRPPWRERGRYRDVGREVDGFRPMLFTVHRDPGGQVDGLLAYRTRLDWGADHVPRGHLKVHELWAADPKIAASLWRYCLEHDLMTRVTARWRPVDEAVADRLIDRRAWGQTLTDGLWLRPLDPAALLAARRYGREDGLVLEVHEPEGSAPRRFRLDGGLEGATCVPATASPDLRLGVAALGSICLGDAPVERLHRAGQIEELTPGAVARATAMFRWSPAPWPGDIF